MFRVALSCTTVISGSYVVYKIFDHPVVKADALALLQNEEYNHQSTVLPAMQSIMVTALRRWVGAFRINHNSSVNRIQNTENEAENDPTLYTNNDEKLLFREGRPQACLPFGAYDDTEESRLLRFAIPIVQEHIQNEGIFTIRTTNHSRGSFPLTVRSRFLQSIPPIIKDFWKYVFYVIYSSLATVRYRLAAKTYTEETMTISMQDEFFPLFGDSSSYFFDVHTWKRITDPDFLHAHKTNETFYLQLNQKLQTHPPHKFRNVVLIVDPFGAPGAIQLTEHLIRRNTKLHSLGISTHQGYENQSQPNISIFYVKPRHWKGKSALDNRLNESICAYRKLLPPSEASLVEVSTDFKGQVERSCQCPKNSTMYIALLSKNNMRLFQSIDFEWLLKKNEGCHMLRVTLE